jgi:hypothetical protein
VGVAIMRESRRPVFAVLVALAWLRMRIQGV